MTHVALFQHTPTAGINVRMVIQKVGKDPEQNVVGCFDEFESNSGILHGFRRKNISPVL